MNFFPFKVGDKVKESSWGPGRFITVEWLGDGAFAGADDQGRKVTRSTTIYNYASDAAGWKTYSLSWSSGTWHPYVEPPVRHTYTVTTERRVIEAGDIYIPEGHGWKFQEARQSYPNYSRDVVVKVERTS